MFIHSKQEKKKIDPSILPGSFFLGIQLSNRNELSILIFSLLVQRAKNTSKVRVMLISSPPDHFTALFHLVLLLAKVLNSQRLGTMMDIEEVLKNTCQPATERKSCLLPSYCYLFCCLNLWVKKLLPLSPAALHLDLLIFKRNFAHNLRLMQPAHYPKLTSPEEMKKSIQK